MNLGPLLSTPLALEEGKWWLLTLFLGNLPFLLSPGVHIFPSRVKWSSLSKLLPSFYPWHCALQKKKKSSHYKETLCLQHHDRGFQMGLLKWFNRAECFRRGKNVLVTSSSIYHLLPQKNNRRKIHSEMPQNFWKQGGKISQWRHHELLVFQNKASRGWTCPLSSFISSSLLGETIPEDWISGRETSQWPKLAWGFRVIEWGKKRQRKVMESSPECQSQSSRTLQATVNVKPNARKHRNAWSFLREKNATGLEKESIHVPGERVAPESSCWVPAVC